MRLIPLLCILSFVAGCASNLSSSPSSADEGSYVTGSNIKRRDPRSGSDHVVSGTVDSSTTTGGQVR